MMSRELRRRASLTRFAIALTLLLTPVAAWAHCDGLDGPVVKAAREALDSGNPAFILVWVPATDEAEVMAAFAKARETVVRLHRLAEGAPYTGLKPAGRDLGPAIRSAEHALDTGFADPVLTLIVGMVLSGVVDQFDIAMEAKIRAGDSVEEGRKYVEAYVAFIHYVDRLFEAASTVAGGHGGVR